MRRAGYADAIALYQRAVEALQRHDYRSASEGFRGVLDRFPEERELLERSRLYVKVCERQMADSTPPPRTAADRVFAATVALNAGSPTDAAAYLRSVTRDEPGNDHAAYMLAVANAQLGDPDAALKALLRSIELNSENRARARQDPDLDPVRQLTAFRTILDSPANSARRRPKPRGR